MRYNIKKEGGGYEQQLSLWQRIVSLFAYARMRNGVDMGEFRGY